MEPGVIPSSESHLWTLSDFIERRKGWDQGDETRLAEYLQHLSNKINQGAKNTLNELNELVASVDDAVVKVANINNKFQLLADKQFIENKVQEEDETVQTNVKEPVIPKTNNADSVVHHLKETLKNSFKAIDTHFEKVTVIVSDSDDDDNNESKHEETVLRPRSFYKKLNLPPLSGSTDPEIVLDCTMSSESDSDVEQATNTYKDEESLSANDISTENIHSTRESKIIQDSEPIVTHNIFEPKQLNPTNGPSYVDNAEDDLFSPPPLLNDNDEDDLDNEYNMFGNSNSNVFGEKSFWDGNDDGEDFSDQPPLPIHSDEPPPQAIKTNTQEKVEAPSIQQSLNDELRKRFQKDNISQLSDNINIESSKIKLPKGAVNILGGTDTKPYIPISVQNIKQVTQSEMNKSVINTKHDSNGDDTDYNISDKLHDDSSQNPLTSARNKYAIKETNPIKKRSFFEQDSDDEDLFSQKTPRVSIPSSEIPIQKDNSGESAKLLRTMFSESDSDEDFLSSKSNNKLSSHPTVGDNTNKYLDSSSDDDLFNNKSILKERSKIQDEEFIEKKKINSVTEQKSKYSIEEKNLKEVMNKELIDELKRKSVNSSVTVNKLVIKEDLTQQSNQKSSNSQHTKSFSNLFSSDEEDLDDSKLFNVNESHRNCVKDKPHSTHLVENLSNEYCTSKMDMFDSSSDDDILNVIKANKNVGSSNTSLKSDSKEIKNLEPKPNDDYVVINQVQKSENGAEVNSNQKNVSNQKTNVFSLLSDDEDDDDDLSFNNIPNNSINLFSSQKIIESSPSEDLLSLSNDPNDIINKNNIQVSLPKDISDYKSETLFNKNKMDLSKNEPLVSSKENKTQNGKSFIFLSDDDDEQLQIKSEEQTKSTLNMPFKDCPDSKKQESLSNKETDISKQEATNKSIENSIQSNKLSSFLCGDNEQKVSCNKMVQNEISKNDLNKVIHKISDSSPKEIILKKSLSHKDSVDGSYFSLPNSSEETPKKLPGKLGKNAGAFINIKGLLPNSKNTPQAHSLDKNFDDNLPTSGTKLFSVEKERARIQVKRRPPSRKARQAARTSYVDIGHESNSPESSRVFGSTPDLVNYQSSPTLNDDVTDSLIKAQNEIQVASNNILFVTDEKNDEKLETKKNILNLFDDDSDSFESSHEEKSIGDVKEKALDEKQPEFKIEHKKLPEVELIDKQIIETAINKLDIESVHKTLPNVQPTNENQVPDIKNLEKIKSKSVTQSIVIPKKSNSLFDDDDDDVLFSSNSEKAKFSSSNIFDSDDDLEFSQKFTKKSLAKAKSIFDDDSDEDLFSTPSKPSHLPLRKPIGKSSQQNLPTSDGYIKLAAESVAINPLESKKD